MAPKSSSFRGRSSSARNPLSGLGTVAEEEAAPTESTTQLNGTINNNSSDGRPSAWERRKRRLQKKKVDATEKEQQKAFVEESSNKNSSSSSRRRSKSTTPSEAPSDDVDPYESDPGESYREHCMKLRGVGTRSCLGVPKFLIKQKQHPVVEEDTVLTAPPSPMASEMGDLFGQVPASLPPNLSRVRYSLRSSITDGAEKQPVGPSVMERRELRPNNVHLNVSHWSDEGGRPYMEDR